MDSSVSEKKGGSKQGGNSKLLTLRAVIRLPSGYDIKLLFQVTEHREKCVLFDYLRMRSISRC